MEKETIFIAIPIDEKYSSQIEESLSYLDSSMWNTTPTSNLHVTALYIGEVDINIIPYVEEIVQNIAKRTKPISFMSARAIIMRPDEPTMLWIKYDRSKYFEDLVSELKKYLKKVGNWEIKLQKSYNKNSNQPIPHITIARIRGGGMLETLLPPLQIDRKLDSFTARKIALYKTIRNKECDGVSYEIINSWDI